MASQDREAEKKAAKAKKLRGLTITLVVRAVLLVILIVFLETVFAKANNGVSAMTHALPWVFAIFALIGTVLKSGIIRRPVPQDDSAASGRNNGGSRGRGRRGSRR